MAIETLRLSPTECAVLGLLGEAPAHGFALSKELEVDADVGRVLTVRRPLVYRALDRLVEGGLVEPVTIEKGDAGPKRVVHSITDDGRRYLEEWLDEPVEHVRDLRLDFLLKVALHRRAGTSPLELIEAQRMALQPTLSALDRPAMGDDHVELWRRHNGLAVAAYLDDLASRYAT